jgi:hypothetical protein
MRSALPLSNLSSHHRNSVALFQDEILRKDNFAVVAGRLLQVLKTGPRTYAQVNNHAFSSTTNYSFFVRKSLRDAEARNPNWDSVLLQLATC